ncbi:hypothetical protein EDD36DRAFT_389724 [Exophiala viscosa]|uniref:GET complex, subunit GET2 n=1 Tax=Exophiala viscosa TaxID=2486360 RepID=A0AAN6DKQ2_9EURO|nr:hypothetical protein EDD36DRAFT_389724 [Exophiala viscosa]
MADAEETPAQRQARIRRQKREAKISGAASERLDKITRLSGRTPESLRTESPVATPPRSSTPSQVPSPSPGSDYTAAPTPEQQKAQEEYLRALLRQPEPQEGQNQSQQPEDPMLKMLQTMMGAMDGTSNPNTPGGAGFPGGLPGLSPDDISKATGLPSFLTNMVMGGQKAPPSHAELQATRLWKSLHVIFALIAGLYLVFTVTRATETFGENPPRPATFQNPFVVFLTGELLVQGTRVGTSGYSGKSGLGLWIQILREFVGDGAIAVFMLGIASWWKGSI